MMGKIGKLFVALCLAAVMLLPLDIASAGHLEDTLARSARRGIISPCRI